MTSPIARAARLIAEADRLLFTAGAGMGVDGGLPDFRSANGFWKAYPLFAKQKLSFPELSTPSSFDDPELGWGFFGHRYELYTRPSRIHKGYHIFREWAAQKSSSFVFTSNVDGSFLEAGFAPDRVTEVHGSIHHLQCVTPCHPRIWDAAPDLSKLSVDTERVRADKATVPHCPRCGGVARPNILMFGDFGFLSSRTDAQYDAYEEFLREPGSLCVIEVGAGHAVPTVRMASEQAAQAPGASLIRINPVDDDIPPELAARSVALRQGGLSAAQEIEEALNKRSSR